MVSFKFLSSFTFLKFVSFCSLVVAASSKSGLFELLLHGEGPLVFLSLKSFLQSLDLILQELVKKLAQFVQVNFSRFVFLQELEDLFVVGLEGCIGLAFDLVPLQEVSHERFNLANLKGSLVVSVDGVVNILTHFSELVNVDQDVSQVLNGLLIVYNNSLISTLVVFLRHIK